MGRTKLNPRAISDPARIEILASPVRQELVDTLSALGGEASAALLADHLGRHADGLYYHLRLLCKAGLITEVRAKADGERLYRLAGRSGAPLRLAYRTGSEGNAEALRAYVHGLLQVAGRDFEQAVERADVPVEGGSRQLWAARNKGWLSPAELEELNVLLERLCKLTSHPRSSRRSLLMSLAFVLSPSAPRPRRRQQGE